MKILMLVTCKARWQQDDFHFKGKGGGLQCEVNPQPLTTIAISYSFESTILGIIGSSFQFDWNYRGLFS